MKDKRYFIEIVIKDSNTLEPVRSISTSSDYPESVLTYPHTKLLKEVDFCINTLCSIHFGNEKDKTYFVDIKKEIDEILINQLIEHPEFNKEKFLETNPQLKEVVEKSIKDREDKNKL